jgi:hypothetical protein
MLPHHLLNLQGCLEVLGVWHPCSTTVQNNADGMRWRQCEATSLPSPNDKDCCHSSWTAEEVGLFSAALPHTVGRPVGGQMQHRLPAK